MDSREQFEAHYNDWHGAGCQYALHHRMGDSYSLPNLSVAWQHWQASRAAVVVVLPSASERDQDTGWCNAIERCQEAVEAAGVTVAV